MSCVYEFRCEITCKSYIGKTTGAAAKRWAAHVGQSKSSQLPFHRAIHKHGKENFRLRIHADGISEIEAFELERKLIAELNTKVPHGYNVTDGGEGNLGLKHSDEAKRKISDALRMRERAPVSDYTKAILREKNIGKTHSKETRDKLSILSKRQHAENPISAEARKRAADSLRGFKHNEFARASMRAAALKKPPASEEHRKNLSLALTGRVVSEETRRKFSEANKRTAIRREDEKSRLAFAAAVRKHFAPLAR